MHSCAMSLAEISSHQSPDQKGGFVDAHVREPLSRTVGVSVCVCV